MKRFLIVLVCVALLAACGESGDKSPPPNIVITIQPQPDATIMPGCETADLESWYEVAGSLIQTFRDESEKALGLSPEQTMPVLSRLIDLRDAIALQPAPECALTVHSSLLVQVRTMLTTFQRYINGDIDEEALRSQITESNRHIDTEIRGLLAGTQAGLEQQLREDRATQAAIQTAEAAQ